MTNLNFLSLMTFLDTGFYEQPFAEEMKLLLKDADYSFLEMSGAYFWTTNGKSIFI